MKITFFKTETHSWSRVTYVYENAELVKPKSNFKHAPHLVGIATGLLLILFILLHIDHFKNHLLLYLAVVFLLFLLHELCHALYCWLTGRKVGQICFFPYGLTRPSPAAYVVPAPGVWNRSEEICLTLFPLLLLSAIPAALSIFFPSVRVWMLLVALLNMSMSNFDISDFIQFLSMPAGFLRIDYLVIVPTQAFDGVVHRILFDKEKQELQHKQFQCQGKKLIEQFPPEETDEVRQILARYKEQFNVP